jgi:hypothetical protein
VSPGKASTDFTGSGGSLVSDDTDLLRILMGIDLHLGSYYISFHVPTPVLLLCALIALYGAWKLGRIALAATGIASH